MSEEQEAELAALVERMGGRLHELRSERVQTMRREARAIRDRIRAGALSRQPELAKLGKELVPQSRGTLIETVDGVHVIEAQVQRPK